MQMVRCSKRVIELCVVYKHWTEIISRENNYNLLIKLMISNLLNRSHDFKSCVWLWTKLLSTQFNYYYKQNLQQQPRFFLLFSTHFNWLAYYLLSDIVQFFWMAAVTGAEADTSVKQSASVWCSKATIKLQSRINQTRSLSDYLRKVSYIGLNTAPFNVTGHPALSINAGFSDGLPVGMMIVGREFDEATVLNVAYAYEKIRHAEDNICLIE